MTRGPSLAMRRCDDCPIELQGRAWAAAHPLSLQTHYGKNSRLSWTLVCERRARGCATQRRSTSAARHAGGRCSTCRRSRSRSGPKPDTCQVSPDVQLLCTMHRCHLHAHTSIALVVYVLCTSLFVRRYGGGSRSGSASRGEIRLSICLTATARVLRKGSIC